MTTDPMQCATCGKPHAGCTAHRRDGQPCGNDPVAGQRVCRMHGVNQRARDAAERRERRAEAQAAVELFAARRDVDPGEALLELVQWTAGEVDYWRQEVRLLERDELTCGVTRVKQGGDDRGATEEAKPHIAYLMLTDASNRLKEYAVAALRAGVEERRVRVAEDQGRLLEQVVRTVVAGLNLTAEQEALVPVVVPAAFRSIAGGS